MHTLCRYLFAAGASIVLVGCASPQIDTTRLTSTDIVKMTDEMTASFAGDEVIGERTQGSDEWVVSIDRVRNLSEHPIPMRERWATMARLRSRLAQTDFARQRGIVWVLPPDLWRQYDAATYNPGTRRLPTHSLHATFLLRHHQFARHADRLVPLRVHADRSRHRAGHLGRQLRSEVHAAIGRVQLIHETVL